MKIVKKLSTVIIALAMCTLLVVTAWAVEEITVSYSATLNDSTLCDSDQEQTVTLTVKASEVVDMDAFTAQVKVPEGLKLTAIANDNLNFTGDNFNLENGMILWYSDTAENVSNDLLATINITVPAETPVGEYEIEFEIIDISRDFGMPWEDGATVSATLTVGEHADGDDQDHLCDYCQGAVEGENCAKYLNTVEGQAASCTKAGWKDYYQCSCGKLYSDEAATTEIPDLEAWKIGDGKIEATGEHVYVPGDPDWSDDYSTCTVVGTCSCGATATATATSTREVTTTGTCQTEEVVTYYAVFAETWAEDQTKEVTGEKNANNHVGEQTTAYTNNGDNHTVTVTCDCGAVISTETEDHDFTDGNCVCGAVEPEEPVVPTGLKGDVNLDGVVDILDFVALAQHIGEVEFITDAVAMANADVNGDNVVDILDFTRLAQYIGEVITEL